MTTSASIRRGYIQPWLVGLAVAVLVPFSVHADDYGDVTKLISAKQYKEALAKADQYLSSKPRDAQMRFIRGVILSESGRNAEAIAVFTKITEDFPELPEPYNNLAVLYAAQNQFDKARAALEMAIRTNPSYVTAHENLGDIYARLASQAYSKALQLDSGNTAVQPKLALIRTLFNPDPKGQRLPAVASPAQPPASSTAAMTPAQPATATAPAPAVSTANKATAAPVTPVASATPAAPSTAAATSQADVDAAVRRWAAAWAAKDMDAYLKAYAKDFDVPGKLSRKAWEEERRNRILGKNRIKVQISEVGITVNGNKATVRFRQNYSADTLNVSSRKTLELVQSGGRWLIVREVASS